MALHMAGTALHMAGMALHMAGMALHMAHRNLDIRNEQDKMDRGYNPDNGRKDHCMDSLMGQHMEVHKADHRAVEFHHKQYTPIF
jgi:hypothetical protein